MALSDLIIKARVNMALAQDPRLSAFDVTVGVENGEVTLSGNVDVTDKCQAAEEDARSITGVTGVRNEMTCGVSQVVKTAQEVVVRFLDKLDAAWDALPSRTAVTQADYINWALWMTYKFHIPAGLEGEDISTLEAAAVERAINQVAERVKASPALLALHMMQQAQIIADSPWQMAPETHQPTLTATPVTDPTTADSTGHQSRLLAHT